MCIYVPDVYDKDAMAEVRTDWLCSPFRVCLATHTDRPVADHANPPAQPRRIPEWREVRFVHVYWSVQSLVNPDYELISV